MSNLNKWDRWYRGLTTPAPYGDTESYEMGAAWLAECDTVEDWGCGKGWFARFVSDEQTYIGLDGSKTPFADKFVDLTTYRSEVDGIFMRHVLEHNYAWPFILENAVASFTQRMALILFTPLTERTIEIAFADDPGVPDLSLGREQLEQIIVDGGAEISTSFAFPSATQYEWETVYLLEKR